ncbi:IS3 family transposase [Xenorhabdus nematophila]|uniref:IS3 family transposase n=1 Tax=Xenorhabdus nematophila TaxID=628 RepID=UPI00183E0706|nr:IS3 family transposase [Xenorhabdus nematophila]MBA0018490.1 IS3 family transposase [Xenorhabdus nematophila]
MKSESKRTQRDYSLAFKLAVVDQVEKGEMTYKQAQNRYGIQGRSTVLVWLRKHGQLDWSLGCTPLHPQGAAMTSSSSLTPEQHIKELEQQLTEMEKKAEFFEAVVDVLKRDYGVTVGKKATRQVIQAKKVTGFHVTQCCRYLSITRQAYYQQCQRTAIKEQQEQDTLRQVQSIRLKQPRIGTRKLQYLLNQSSPLKIGRDSLFDLLRTHHLLVRPKRAYHKTTQSHHRFYCHPNLLKAGSNKITPTGPEQVWVADITYLPVKMGEAYLSLITDAWSRKIVGHHVHDNLKTDAVIKAYKQALKNRKLAEKSRIHHSDRGLQYCSKRYQALHKHHEVICSMTDGHDCYQNALAERVNGILKTEFLLSKPSDLEEAIKMVSESIEIYNRYRPHLALKYKTPDEVHHQALSKNSVNVYQD